MFMKGPDKILRIRAAKDYNSFIHRAKTAVHKEINMKEV